MLRIYRRHERSWCSKTSKADPHCAPKVTVVDGKKVKVPSRGTCPVYLTGTLQDGTFVKPESLNTRNWQLASQKAMEMEAGVVKTKALSTPLKEAADLFVLSKGKKSADRQRKLRRITDQLITFADREGKTTVQGIDLPLLIRFVASWADANSTQITSRENLRSFFRFCVKKAKCITDNPAEGLEPMAATTPQTEVFTHDELKAIMHALDKLSEEYGRAGRAIALQTKAFVLVMR
jgi:hypothetical protein